MGKRRFLSTSSSSSSSSCFKKKVKRTSTYERAPRSNSSSLVAFAACRHEETLQSLLLLPIISLAPYPLNCWRTQVGQGRKRVGMEEEGGSWLWTATAINLRCFLFDLLSMKASFKTDSVGEEKKLLLFELSNFVFKNHIQEFKGGVFEMKRQNGYRQLRIFSIGYRRYKHGVYYPIRWRWTHCLWCSTASMKLSASTSFIGLSSKWTLNFFFFFFQSSSSVCFWKKEKFSSSRKLRNEKESIIIAVITTESKVPLRFQKSFRTFSPDVHVKQQREEKQAVLS